MFLAHTYPFPQYQGQRFPRRPREIAPGTYYRVKPGLCLSFILLFVPGGKHPQTGIYKIYGRKSVRIANSPLVFPDTSFSGQVHVGSVSQDMISPCCDSKYNSVQNQLSILTAYHSTFLGRSFPLPCRDYGLGVTLTRYNFPTALETRQMISLTIQRVIALHRAKEPHRRSQT